MKRIACLHTADSNRAVFDAALAHSGVPGVALIHEVRADLLAEAEAVGGLTDDLARRTLAILEVLAGSADAVLLTCSTLGPAVEMVEAAWPAPVLRVDAALARRAVAEGGRVVVVCAVETTLAPTRTLFTAEADKTGADLDIRLVDGAWAKFRSGDLPGYLSAIAAAAAQAIDQGADVVALAQASMAAAANDPTLRRRPLTSPDTGLAAALSGVAQRTVRPPSMTSSDPVT